MERKLIDYLPPVLRDYAEFQGITPPSRPNSSGPGLRRTP